MYISLLTAALIKDSITPIYIVDIYLSNQTK